MSVFGGWVLAPLVLMLLCGGAGLLAERIAGARLPGPAVPGLGLAVLVAVAGLLTVADATAELATPACALVAVAGWALGWRRVRWSRWPFVTGVAAFALLAWPSVGTGQASVTGYIKLDDSAVWLGLIDHLMQHGRDLAGVPRSTFQRDLVAWLGNGYPVGAFTPVGVTARLTGQAYVNAYQPVIAVYGVLLALGIAALVRPLMGSAVRAAACALVAVQASLFFGYAQWGSIKEVAAAALLAALLATGLRGGGVRGLLLAALPAGALLDTYGAGGVIWAGPAMVVLGVVVLARRGLPVPRRAAAVVGAVALVAVAAVPVITVLGTDVRATATGSPVNQEDIGKLLAPLEVLQGAGLWLAGDFRRPPDPQWPSVLLAVAGLWLAAAAVALAVRRRRWEVPAMAGIVLVAAVAGMAKGGPWIDAKVLAITSPFLLAASAALVACLPRGALVLAPVGVVALVSTWLIARDVYVTPRDELVELRALGRQLAGQGPSLLLDYEGYATRHLLAPAQLEGATDLRYSQVPKRDGSLFPDFTTAEVDDVAPDALFAYRTIVRRRTPVGSAPPGGYRTVHAGRFFEAWRRDGTPLPAQHLPLGSPSVPAAPLECRTARRAARTARRLVAAPRVNPVVAGRAAPPRDGRLTFVMPLPRAGRWRAWVGGGVLGHLRVSVDGKPVGAVRHQLDASVGWLRFGSRQLAAGPHRVTLDYARGAPWRPGRGRADDQLPLGPVALSLEDQPARVRVPSSQVDRLCDGRDYDWLETYQ